jgi:fibronectin type 3 domain-containing protein
MTLSTRITPNNEMPDKYPIDTVQSPERTGSYCYPPITPSNLQAKATSDSTIKLSWEPVSQALLYRIYRSVTADGPYSLVGTSIATQGTHADIGLPDNTTFHYMVTAVGGDNDGCESDYSDEAEATTFRFVPEIEWIPKKRGRHPVSLPIIP